MRLAFLIFRKLDDSARCLEVGGRLRGISETLVVLGIGGSSLADKPSWMGVASSGERRWSSSIMLTLRRFRGSQNSTIEGWRHCHYEERGDARDGSPVHLCMSGSRPHWVRRCKRAHRLHHRPDKALRALGEGLGLKCSMFRLASVDGSASSHRSGSTGCVHGVDVKAHGGARDGRFRCQTSRTALHSR